MRMFSKGHIKRGKIPIPTMHIIRLKGKLKQYINTLSSGDCFEYHYRFWVRGHFRTLKDEKRWGSNVGRRIWILPYIKGKVC